jgi:hypothetical protein
LQLRSEVLLNFEYLFGSGGTDLLVHRGRHFGRTVYGLCTVSSLVNNGIIQMGELATQPDKIMTEEERGEHRVFKLLVQVMSGLENRLVEGSDKDVAHIA